MSEESAEQSGGSSYGIMVGLAWVLILVGAFTTIAAFGYDVGVSSGSAGLYGIPDRVANTDKLAIRHMILACGLAGFISGWIVLSAAMVIGQLARR